MGVEQAQSIITFPGTSPVSVSFHVCALIPSVQVSTEVHRVTSFLQHHGCVSRGNTGIWVPPWELESVGGSYLRGIPQRRLFRKISFLQRGDATDFKASFQVNTLSERSAPLPCQTPLHALTPSYEYRDPVAGLCAKLARVTIRLKLQLQPHTSRDETTA